MKSTLLMLSLALTLVACSSSNDDKGAGANTPFGKASSGEWLSDCLTTDQGQKFRENMKLNGSSGSITYWFFQTTDCSGNVTNQQGPNNFTYTTKTLNDKSASVTINRPGTPATTVQVLVFKDNAGNDKMTVSGPNGSITYSRIGGGPGKEQNGETRPAPGNGAEAFDAAARGTWASTGCSTENNISYVTIMTINGGGQASLLYNVYNNQNCGGEPTPQQNQPFTYTVQDFSMGEGTILVGNNPLRIRIRGPNMTVTTAQVTENYQKIR